MHNYNPADSHEESTFYRPVEFRLQFLALRRRKGREDERKAHGPESQHGPSPSHRSRRPPPAQARTLAPLAGSLQRAAQIFWINSTASRVRVTLPSQWRLNSAIMPLSASDAIIRFTAAISANS